MPHKRLVPCRNRSPWEVMERFNPSKTAEQHTTQEHRLTCCQRQVVRLPQRRLQKRRQKPTRAAGAAGLRSADLVAPSAPTHVQPQRRSPNAFQIMRKHSSDCLALMDTTERKPTPRFAKLPNWNTTALVPGLPTHDSSMVLAAVQKTEQRRKPLVPRLRKHLSWELIHIGHKTQDTLGNARINGCLTLFHEEGIHKHLFELLAQAKRQSKFANLNGARPSALSPLTSPPPYEFGRSTATSPDRRSGSAGLVSPVYYSACTRLLHDHALRLRARHIPCPALLGSHFHLQPCTHAEVSCKADPDVCEHRSDQQTNTPPDENLTTEERLHASCFCYQQQAGCEAHQSSKPTTRD